MNPSSLIIFIFLFNAVWLWHFSATATYSPLAEKQLRVIAPTLPGTFDVTRNATGHVVQIVSPIPYALDWLSTKYKFTYSYVPIKGLFFIDDFLGLKGGMSYLRQGEAEMIVGAVAPVYERFLDSDFSASWTEGPFSILIPITNSSTNIAALVQPMNIEVWICIGLSIPTVIGSLYGLTKWVDALNNKLIAPQNEGLDSDERQGSFGVSAFVLMVILSQGGYCGKKQFAIRLAVATWSLGCFVLIQAYSCTLISHITSPNRKPVINSIYDIPTVPGLKITITKNEIADLVLSKLHFGIFEILGKSVRENPDLLCHVTDDCLKKVREGNHVFIHGDQAIRRAIAMDRKLTGTCHFTRARDTIGSGFLIFILAKRSLYTETVNRGILELRATGLMDEWNKKFNPEPTECLMKYKEKANDKTRLSLRNLTSAFVLVVFGWVLSTIIFVAELVRRFLYSKNTFCSAKQSCFNIASILPSRRSNTPERNTE